MTLKQKISKKVKEICDAVKFVSKEEAFWTKFRDDLLENNVQMERQIVINMVMIDFADTQLKEEKGKV